MSYRSVLRGAAVCVGAAALMLGLSASNASAGDAASLFKTKCASCHGASGEGDGAAGKFLKPPPPDFSSADWGKTADAEGVKKIIKQGGKAVGKAASMPGFGSLSDADIDALVKLVLGFAGK